MKVNLLKAVALMLSGLIISCCKPVPVEDCIYPVSPSDEVEAFFTTYLPPIAESHYTGFDLGEKLSCFLINSTSELEEIAPNDVELPSIDFDRYTLIIGRMPKGSTGYTYKGQKISFESGRTVLTVTYEGPDGAVHPTITYYNFWGLYDKLQDTEIELNIKIE